MRKLVRWNLALLVALAFGDATAAQHKPEQRDMALVGYSDLQARSAYQPTIARSISRRMPVPIQRSRCSG